MGRVSIQYALDENGQEVTPRQAEPGERYWCGRCEEPVFLRDRKDAVIHFFHMDVNSGCPWSSGKDGTGWDTKDDDLGDFFVDSDPDEILDEAREAFGLPEPPDPLSGSVRDDLLCGGCDLFLSTLWAWRDHQRDEEDGHSIACPTCGEEFHPHSTERREKFIEHVLGCVSRRVPKSDQYPCPYCNAERKNKNYLKHHVREIHEKAGDDVSPQVYEDIDRMKHRSLDRERKCLFCGEEFENLWRFAEHLQACPESGT